VKLWGFDGRDGSLVHGVLEFVMVVLDHSGTSPANFEGLSWRRGRLKLFWLRLRFWRLGNLSVAIVKLEIPGKSDG
jgi:hypothetical protein